MPERIPLVSYLVIDDGAPYLLAWESVDSGALYLGRRNADARSGGTEFRRRRLSRTGTVRTFTIVHRAGPGVSVPFVSVVVDLDGGGVVRANLLDVAPEPGTVPPGLRVELTTYVAGRDREGKEAVAFAFRPLREPDERASQPTPREEA